MECSSKDGRTFHDRLQGEKSMQEINISLQKNWFLVHGASEKNSKAKWFDFMGRPVIPVTYTHAYFKKKLTLREPAAPW